MRKKLCLVVCLIFVMGLTGCKKEAPLEEVPLLSPVTAVIDAAPVVREDLSSMSIYNGEVMVSVEELGFDVDGYLYSVYVDPGDHVYEGEVLAGITGPDYQQVKNLEDEIKKLKESNEDELETKLKDRKIAELKGYDLTLIDLEIQQLKERQELNLKQKQDRLDKLRETDFGYIYITAPYETNVIATTSKKGYLRAGTPVVALEGKGDPYVACDFIKTMSIEKCYEYYALIHGERVELEFIPYDKENLKELSARSEVPDAAFKILGEDMTGIIPGDYAAVFVVESYKPDVLTVPVNAIFTDNNGRFVYEIVDNARVRRPVKVGVSDDVNIEILEGIEEGAYVYVKN